MKPHGFESNVLTVDCPANHELVGDRVAVCREGVLDKPLGYCRSQKSNRHCNFRDNQLCHWTGDHGEKTMWHFVKNIRDYKFLRNAELTYFSPESTNHVVLHQTKDNNTTKISELVSPQFKFNLTQDTCIRMRSLKSEDAELKLWILNHNTNEIIDEFYSWKFFISKNEDQLNDSSDVERSNDYDEWIDEMFYFANFLENIQIVVQGNLSAQKESGIAIDYIDLLSTDECRAEKIISVFKFSCITIGCGNGKNFSEGFVKDCSEQCINPTDDMDCSPDYEEVCLKACEYSTDDENLIINYLNGEIQVNCKDFDIFYLDGEFECNRLTGKWKTQPSCKRRCYPLKVATGTILVEHSNETAIFECARNMSNYGELKIHCVDGEWDSNVPICYNSDCPMVSGWSNYTMTIENSLVQLSCANGSLMVGDQFSNCVDGEWAHQLGYCLNLSSNDNRLCNFNPLLLTGLYIISKMYVF